MSNILDVFGGIRAYRPVFARSPFLALKLGPQQSANAEQLGPCELGSIKFPPNRLHDYRAKHVWDRVVVGKVWIAEFPLSIGTLLFVQLCKYRTDSASAEWLTSFNQKHCIESHTSIR